ncbi:MAG: hypothetical protein V1822_01325 [Candidatus Micrarchaeota archaeon]
MPLDTAKALFQKRGFIVQTAFWAGVFVAAYIIMMKVMHPGWGFFGI